MINDMKMSFKILRYGINITSSIVFAIIFFILAFFFDMVGSSLVVTVYMPLVGIYFGQIAHSVVQSTMVQTSPYKKTMQTKIPALVMFVIVFVNNTLNILWKRILLNINPWCEKDFIMAIIMGGLMTIVIMLYFAFAMKVYWPATICFFVVFYTWAFGTGFGSGMTETILAFRNSSVTISMPVATIFSYVCIFIGSAMNYGVNVLLYKKDYSQQNFKKALDRAK